MQLDPLILLTVSSFAAALSAFVAGLGLLVNAWATWQARRTRELQLFEHVFSDIRSLEEKLYVAAASGAGREVTRGWRSLFLNTLEFFSFLVNRRYLRDKRLAEFFSGALVRWHQDVFLSQATEEERSDPEIYPELKSFYERLRPAVPGA